MINEELSKYGFTVVDDLVTAPECDALSAAVAKIVSPGAGVRDLLSIDWAKELATVLRQKLDLQKYLGEEPVAVQCTYFSKSCERNWLVPFHQDLSISVNEKVPHESLSGWSCKEGRWFVQPPVNVLERLLAVRLHLDPCPSSAGPLRVIPQSHKLGRMTDQAILAVRKSSAEIVCEVSRGGAVIMHPLLLHASSKMTGQHQRRVLHFVFGPPILPHSLRWAFDC